MTISDMMTETLAKIIQRHNELGTFVQDSRPSDEQIALRLIKIYRETDDLESRQLIMEFMTDAGYAWLRKLFTRDDNLEEELAAA